MIIMPSMPRLSTPDRSTTSSPAAASNSGVDAAITEMMMASSNPIGNPGARRHQTNAVEDQGVAGEHVEQQDALKHLGEIERHLHRDLGLLAADESQCEEQARDQDANRIEPSEEGDDDGGEAIARRDAGLEMPDRPGHFDDARQPRQCAGNQEGDDHETVGVEAGEARGARRGADHTDLESHDGTTEHDRRNHDDDERDDGAEMQPGALDQDRHRCDRIEFRRSREIEAVGIAPWTAHEIVEEEFGDIDEHQAGEDLAGAEPDLTDRRNERIKRSADRP